MLKAVLIRRLQRYVGDGESLRSWKATAKVKGFGLLQGIRD